ncbi:hypothetical protein HUJ04_003331 [Dendroctonus ponderosae]|nr:hypothetical protein HUJ04_003331 [Dendroctonus ponderosae]KAH1009940.1 hypothetical protein HUJ05_004316 [Dendroctonus ponderosae]
MACLSTLSLWEHRRPLAYALCNALSTIIRDLHFRPDAKNIWDRKAMMGEIKSGKHVYIDWKIKLQYMIKEHFIDSGECSFALGVEEFCEEQIALIVAPDTPYLHKINEEIKKLHQVGLIQKWLSDYLPKKDKCWKKKRTIEVNNHTVNLDDMQGSFFVLFIGFLIAVIVISLEMLWSRKVTNNRKRKVVHQFGPEGDLNKVETLAHEKVVFYFATIG